jgi:DNA polymerase (family 10)
MMDSRTAAHVLSQIASYLELKGENSFKCRAYAGAAKALMGVGTDDLGALYHSGELGKVRGLGPATLAVVRDLVETGESRYLEQLRESTPEGLVGMLDIPGLTPERIRQIYESSGIETVEQLEAAAKDGRLAKVPKLGPKTAAKILAGIATARERGTLRLSHHVAIDAHQLLAAVRSHPDVTRAEIAGTLRRRMEVAARVDIVAACATDPIAVAQSFARLPGIHSAGDGGASVSLQFADGAQLDLVCVAPEDFGVALWQATGSSEHVAEVTERLGANGFAVETHALRDERDAPLHASDESDVYAFAQLVYIEPELREGRGEVEAAAQGALPTLVAMSDIRGVLHCHSLYSDGKASIADMAGAARARGWSYIGITDHSQAAFYAGGLSPERIRTQLAEIDELNATFTDFRILKGIEADILADGRLDYGDELLDRFDFVIGSIHSRFSMDLSAMTARIIAALDDPRLTILGHPTGRLLLSRGPYAIDMNAVLQKAAEVGAAVELNADPKRLDLDWRHLRRAKTLGATIEIGPDAHSIPGLDVMEIGVGIARKGWLEASDVLNARPVEHVIAFARARRDAH